MRSSLVHAAWLVAAACEGESASTPDAAVDAGDPPWATYVITAGKHEASLVGRTPKNPIDGVASVVGRDYDLILNSSSIYELTMPVQPEDQFDWNKLPGLSDCGTIDLSVDGVMLGWRWRLDVMALEITAYANNAGVHLTPETVLFTLDAADLAAGEPLHYRVWREVDRYAVEVTGTMRGRPIAAAATLPRRCTEEALDPIAWAGGFYFGGTSTAPHEVTAQVRERAFTQP